MKCMLFIQIIFFLLLIKLSLFSCNKNMFQANSITNLYTGKITVQTSEHSKSNNCKKHIN